jgi:CBS domain containing-hemolysin-like protein
VAEPEWVLLGLGLALALDMLIAAARAALLRANLARQIAPRAPVEPEVARLLELVRRPARLQASLFLLQTVTRFLLAAATIYLAVRLSPAQPFWVYTLILLGAALLSFWLEWLVRAAILRDVEGWALRMAPLARLLEWLVSPFVALPLLLAGNSPGWTEIGNVTEDELKTLVDAGQKEGVLEKEERKMIYSIFELGDTLAREIMVPRIDMLVLEAGTPIQDAVEVLLESGYSRVPVYADTVDHTLGLLYTKDLLRLARAGSQPAALKDLLRPAYFVPEAKKVDELLAEMQSQRIHMAIVVDEYGGVAGLVTLEDIVEEILGEIQDEYDQGEELPYQALPGGEYLFQGRVDLDDFNEVLASSLSKDEADTLGGFIYSRLGRVPAPGETVRVDQLQLVAEQVIGRRIRLVRARWLPEKAGETDTENNGSG